MLLKIMILALIAAFAGLFFLNGPDGEAILTLEDMKPDVSLRSDSEPESTRLYRWQDENGVWQFSNHPNDAAQGETMELSGPVNTIAAVKPRIKTRPESSGSTWAIPEGLTTVSPEKIEEMMETVNGLQDQVEQRRVNLDEIVGNE